MATPNDIDAAFGLLRDAYGRAEKWPGAPLREAWAEEFHDTGTRALFAALRAAMAENEKFPPTLAVVMRMVKAGEQPSARAGIVACPDCRGFPGWREMARHFVGDHDLPEVVVRMAACDCVLGRASSAPGWRQVFEAWNRIPGTTAVFKTHRDAPELSAEQRLPARLIRRTATPTTDAIRARWLSPHVDDHREARAATLRRDWMSDDETTREEW